MIPVPGEIRMLGLDPAPDMSSESLPAIGELRKANLFPIPLSTVVSNREIAILAVLNEVYHRRDMGLHY